jgi:hypothetical protein
MRLVVLASTSILTWLDYALTIEGRCPPLPDKRETTMTKIIKTTTIALATASLITASLLAGTASAASGNQATQSGYRMTTVKTDFGRKQFYRWLHAGSIHFGR